MNGIPFYVTFFAFFCLLGIPFVIAYYVINLWLNRRDPSREVRSAQKPLSAVEKSIRVIAGVLMILLAAILAGWPFFAALYLKDPEFTPKIKGAQGVLAVVFGLKEFFLLPSLLLGLGLAYIRSGRKGNRDAFTPETTEEV